MCNYTLKNCENEWSEDEGGGGWISEELKCTAVALC